MESLWRSRYISHQYDPAGPLNRVEQGALGAGNRTAPIPENTIFKQLTLEGGVLGPAHPTFGQDRISRNVHDAAGEVVETWDGVGSPLARREAAWTHNKNGQKTSLTDARGYRAEMTHDGHGRQMRWIFPSKTTPGVADQADFEEYAYDPDGNRIAMRKRDGSSAPGRKLRIHPIGLGHVARGAAAW